MRKLMLVVAMVAVVLVAAAPAIAQVTQELSERRITSGSATPKVEIKNTGDNVNECGPIQQIAQTGNVANEQGVTQYDRSILERSTNYRYGATTLLTAPKARTGRSAERFSLSYVTGTHNLKVGVTDEQGFNDESRSRNNV